jgi:peptidyl-prolyl cis-trans isomerase C
MARFLRDPLLHFLLLGAVIFLAYLWLNPGDKFAAGNQIHVGQNNIDRLVQIFQKQWQRMPTRQELDGLVSAHLKEEILYREALALGLEKDDAIVRRRLAQKMEFLITDITDPDKIDENDLVTFYENNGARYTRAAILSFRQIYFNPELRGDRITDEADAALETLQTTHAGIDTPDEPGDPSMLQQTYNRASTDDIARDFGRAFADKLATLTPGSWHGRIESGYGLHLVYIQAREDAGVLPFAEVREQVRNDYLYELRQSRSDATLEKLKSRYEITIAPYQ